MKHIALIILMTLSFQAFADGVYLGGWSKHIITRGDGGYTLNENHNIVAVEYKGWLAGYFKNSYYDDSGLVAKKYPIMSNDTWELDVAVGLSYGYRTCNMEGRYPWRSDKEVCPAVVPELTYTRFKVQPSFMVMTGAIVMAVKVDF